MYKALLLDFGGVVFRNKTEYEGPVGVLDIDKDLWSKGTVGQVDDNTIFSETGNKYNVSAETIVNWLISRREVNDDLLTLVSKIDPEFKTAIINNGIKTLFRILLEKYDVTNKFDLVVNSAEEGTKKPDPGLYLITCERLGVKPQECVFVDDNEEYIKGAESLGMRGILFTNLDKLEEELMKLQILGQK